jgi:hypothetical protein
MIPVKPTSRNNTDFNVLHTLMLSRSDDRMCTCYLFTSTHDVNLYITITNNTIINTYL